jgi:hypothetical protein
VEHGLLVCTNTIAIGNGFIHKGQIARAGHPVTKKYPNAFEPLKVDFDHEEPSTSRHAKRSEPEPKPEPKTEEAPAKSVPKAANVKFANPPTRKK